MPGSIQPGAVASSRAYRAIGLDEIDSTNAEALRRARAGETGRLWVVADVQTAGRGRLSRPWVSPRGNLYASLLLVAEVSPASAAQLGFVTGVALAQALRPLVPSDVQVALKWPNDCLANGAKIAGILLEGAVLPDGRFACVAGCGVNCLSHPDIAAYPAADLAGLGAAVAAKDVFSRFSDAFALEFERWKQEGFEPIRRTWLDYAWRRGQTLSIARSNRLVQGVFETIDPTGRLVLRTEQGVQILDTGDVMLPAAAFSAG
ncbi:MAG: biotin--[acetyl-CoA-carboxylase] ligase [Beijerinckiaceae bacterium]